MTDREKVLDWVQRVCNDSTLEDVEGLSLIIDKLLVWFEQELGIASKTVSRYSVSYKSTIPTDIGVLLSPYRKLRIV